MADVLKLVDELSRLTVLEAAELAKLLNDKWQPSKASQPKESITDRKGTILNTANMTLEHFISDLNSLAFFREFTFSQNTFKPASGGTELELADNVVWMGDDLAILQLKERSAKDVKDESSETRWFQQKVLGTATKQVRDTLKFLEANPAIKVTNERGHSFDIRDDQLRTKTKVVVYLSGKIVPVIAKTTSHYVSKTGGGFIHVLSASDYLEVCRTLRVPADIRDYFGYRQRLLEGDPNLAVEEPLIMGQYLSGDETIAPSKDSYKYLLALQQSSDFDLSRLLSNLHRQIEHQKHPYDYYEILRQFARLPRSGWKEAKTRLAYCIDAVQAQEYRPPTRFAWKELSLGFVFVPMDPKLIAEENFIELMGRGLVNLTAAHKHDQKLGCCVGVIVAKDGEELLLNWAIIKQPWEHDAVLDKALKDNFPFPPVREKVIPRFEFK